MASSVIVKFDSLPVDGDYVSLRPDNTGGGGITIFFKPQRTKAGEVGIRSTINEQINVFTFIFNIDFDRGRNIYTLELLSANRLRISRSDSNIDYFDGAFSNNNNVVIESTDTVPLPIKPVLESITFNAGGNVCGDLNPTFTFNEGLDSFNISSDEIVYLDSYTAKTFSTRDLQRGDIYRFTAKIGAYTISQRFSIPIDFRISYIDQIFTLNSYTARIITNDVRGQITLEYSLNNTEWKLSNEFTGLTPDTYTAYVRDEYGCVKTLAFTVVDNEEITGRLEPLFEYPESNSIHMVKRDGTGYENYFNTLSFEESSFKSVCFRHLFKKTDVPTIQFRSTYNTHIVKLIDPQENEIIVDVEQKSENTNIFDIRDGRATSLGGNVIGVYFLGGNTYDPITRAVNGINYYDKNLPYFLETGKLIKLGSFGWTLITDIVYSEEKEAWVAVTNYRSNSITNSNVIVEYNYHQQPYEEFEFDLNLTGLEGFYRLQMEVTNDEGSFLMESENIEVRETHPKTFEIISSNSDNNEINYNTGIKHIMRLPYITQKTYGTSKEIEVNRTDTKISHLGSRLTDKFTFEFFPMPMAIAIKLSRILALDNVFIDGVGYIAEDDFETERLDSSNLYDFTATMTPNNKQFDSSSNKNVISNTQYTGGFIQLSDGKGFIKLRP